jgi:DNA-binding CsgD family transcriptional regulator
MAVLTAYGKTGRIAAAAEYLGLSVQTVKNTLSLTYRILDVPGIAAALWTVFVEDSDH